MHDILHKIERVIILVLIALMVVVVALSTVELGWIIVTNLVSPPVGLLDTNEILDIFGFFLLVLIGVELLSTLSAYLRDSVVHAEVVVEVAIIAIARKVIILDLKDNPGINLLGIAAIVVTLAAALFALKRLRVGSAGKGADPASSGPAEGADRHPGRGA